jgi:hypothetical protein
LGNPPWLKVEWNEAGILGERNPVFAVRKISASDLAKLRAEAFAHFRPASRLDCKSWKKPKARRTSSTPCRTIAAQRRANQPLQMLHAAGLG